PVPQARIAVWSTADSVLVTGGVSGADGSFRIEGLRPGQYYLRVSHLGHATATVRGVAITPAAPRATVEDVRLAAGAVALEGITATTERSTVTTQPDRSVYNAANLPAATGGNATDVLRNVPGVEVDGDGKVSVRGNENVAIQINGRPAPLRGDALTNFLKQLPASMVERVEVVPNPSAKYDPDGMGGILNIVLKQNTELGLSGGLTVGAATGGRYNGNGNLGWQRGALTLFGSYGLFSDQRVNTGFNFRETRDSASTVLGYLNQDIDGRFENLSHTVSANADLKLGSANTLSGALMFSTRDGNMNNTNAFNALDPSRVSLEQFDELTRVGMDNTTTDLSLAFKRVMQPQRHELSAEVRLNRSDDANLSRYTRFPYEDGVLDDAPVRVRTNDFEAGVRDFSFQVDYTRALGSTLKLETGYKGTLRQVENDFAESVVNTPGPSPADLANAFVYDQDVHAVYGILSNAFGKVNLQAGLRAEQANTSFDLTTTGETFENDYTSFFPSGAATWQVDDQRQLRASYSRRIQRPDVRLLNPFPFSEDEFNRFQGNPRLSPEYTDSYELGLQQSTSWGSLNLSPFYRRTTDAIRRVKEVEAGSNLSVVTFENLATSESYGADFNSTLRLGRITGFGGMSAYRVVTDGSNLDEGLGSDALAWTVRASLTYKLTPATEVTWFQFYRAPMDVEQGRISAFSMANFALRQKFWGDKASLAVRVSDPFDQMGFRFRTADLLHAQQSERRWGARAAYLTFSYNFGQAPRLRNRPPQQPQQQEPQPEIGIN
ncbi:MAG TPA: TonB-dependent receptor, partial [Longimicrobiaceae bacterium]|nr:TonB-dependent receptor [Longimicrobiaceae bacterium]